MSVRTVYALIREDDIKHDPWGTAMSWHFAIADCLVEWGPPYPPAAWHYRQAAGGPETDSYAYMELSGLLSAGEITASDLVKVGNVLARFENLCELRGMSY